MTPIKPAPKWGQCLQCGRPLDAPPPSAPHKKFCSPKCRQEWHSAERRRAIAALRAGAGASAQQEESE